MRGGCSFRDALAQRLDLIQPTVAMLQDYLKLHPPRLTPGIEYVKKQQLIAMQKFTLISFQESWLPCCKVEKLTFTWFREAFTLLLNLSQRS